MPNWRWLAFDQSARDWRMISSSSTSQDSSHPHNLITAIHVNHLSGDCRSAVTSEKGSRRAKFARQNVSLQRGVSLVMSQYFGETGNAARGQCVHRAGADAVHPDAFRAEVVSKVA